MQCEKKDFPDPDPRLFIYCSFEYMSLLSPPSSEEDMPEFDDDEAATEAAEIGTIEAEE